MAAEADHGRRRERGATRGSARRVVVVLITALAAWSAVLGWIARGRLAGDPRGFIRAGLRYYHGAAFDDVALFGPRGYDGEFYATLATDPLLLRGDTAWGLDAPGYRARRIGVPLLAWLTSAGQARAALYAYVVICWLPAILAAPLLALWLRGRGISQWWSLLAVPSAGLAASILRATPDGVAVALTVAALLAWREGRRGTSVGLATFAVVVRETSLIACVGLALASWREGRRRTATAFLLLPALVLAPWVARLVAEFGGQTFGGVQNIAVPFAWLPAKLVQLQGLPIVSPEWPGTLAVVMSILALAAVARRKVSAEAWVLAGFCALALVLGWKVYVDVWAYARVLAVIPVLAVAVAAESGGWRRSSLLAVGGAWAVTGALLVLPGVRGAADVTDPARIAAGYGVRGAASPNGVPPPSSDGATPRAERVGYAFPVAHDRGGRRAWRTDLSIVNEGDEEASIVVEVLKSSDFNYPWPCRLRLGRGRQLVLADALDRLFAWTGRVALRATVERGSPVLRFRTYDVGDPDHGAWLPTVAAVPDAPRPGEPTMSAVASDVESVSSIALVNASDRACTATLVVDPGSDRCRSLGKATILPWRFAEFDAPFGPDRPAPTPFAVTSSCPEVMVAVASGGGRDGPPTLSFPPVVTDTCSGGGDVRR